MCMANDSVDFVDIRMESTWFVWLQNCAQSVCIMLWFLCMQYEDNLAGRDLKYVDKGFYSWENEIKFVLFQVITLATGRSNMSGSQNTGPTEKIMARMYWTLYRPINPLALSRFWLNFRWVIFKQLLMIRGWVISCEITLRWMSQGLTDDKSTLV